MSRYTQIVIINYPASGESIAYRRDDPDLVQALIELANIDYDNMVTVAELQDDSISGQEIEKTSKDTLIDENNLKEYRKKNMLTQSQLGKILGCTPTSIHRWEHGVHPMSKLYRSLASKFFQQQETKK